MPNAPATHKPAKPKTKVHEIKKNQRWGKGRGGRPWERKRKRVFERDNYLCQMCLAENRVTAVELHGPKHGVCDHIVPKSQGGSDEYDNLQTICQRHDKLKTQKESQR